MARLRYNGLSTTLGASLTNSATSVTFAAALTHSGGTNVPTISGTDYIPLSILDGTGKLSEVVYLTAYTAAATTGTIVRGLEGTTGVSHSSGDKVVCAPTKVDVSGDPPPNAPNAKDDEFDGTSAVSWTTTPTAPNASDIDTTERGCLYVKASGSGAVLVGKYQAVPASYPYTITTKVHSTGRLSFHKSGGIILIPSSPTNSSSALLLSHTARSSANAGIQRTILTLGGTFSSESSAPGPLPEVLGPAKGPRYLRVKVNSATSVDTLASADGKAWFSVESGLNPGFTPAFMGLACNEESGAGGVEAYFDFFRVT
jgi:hypothetical protein